MTNEKQIYVSSVQLLIDAYSALTHTEYGCGFSVSQKYVSHAMLGYATQMKQVDFELGELIRY